MSSERNANPPIKGHELISEGHIRGFDGRVIGGCRCGVYPGAWRGMSVNDVKRWHREHKAELRAAGGGVRD
jgi:hypothetical protein